MILFPNCKINLGLHITRKRNDGYHDIETLFYPVGLKDALEMVISENGHKNYGVDFSSSGLEIASDTADNLCVKAYHLLKKDFPSLPFLQMHLLKKIPMGAGLGGGSADGAFALLLLNQLCHLGLSEDQLMVYALQLGSDCPFFIRNKPCIAKGRGEKMKESTLDLSAYTFLIVNPGIHISTAKAFAGIKPQQPELSIEKIIEYPVNQWKELLSNDFEKTIGKEYPNILQIKEDLYQAGAIYASMTGSGSSVYGLFEKENDTGRKLKFEYPTYLV